MPRLHHDHVQLDAAPDFFDRMFPGREEGEQCLQLFDDKLFNDECHFGGSSVDGTCKESWNSLLETNPFLEIETITRTMGPAGLVTLVESF